MKKIDVVFNVLTGERTETERDETVEEKTFRLEHEAKIAAEQAEAEAKATAKAALLAQLGITEE